MAEVQIELTETFSLGQKIFGTRSFIFFEPTRNLIVGFKKIGEDGNYYETFPFKEPRVDVVEDVVQPDVMGYDAPCYDGLRCIGLVDGINEGEGDFESLCTRKVLVETSKKKINVSYLQIILKLKQMIL